RPTTNDQRRWRPAPLVVRRSSLVVASTLELHHRRAVAALALVAKAERTDGRVLLQIVADEGAQGAGSAAVDNSRLFEARGIGVVHITVQQGRRLVHAHGPD